jgi:hypothetical protein
MEILQNRRIKRFQFKAFEKQIRTLYDRDRELELMQSKPFYVPLEKPLFIGYEKYFVLRDDFKSPIVETLLKLINSHIFSKTKDFTYRVRRKSKAAQLQKGRKNIPIEHSLRMLTPNEWSKLSPDEQKYFFKKEIQKNNLQKTVYVWSYPWMFEPRIRKKYLTKIQVIDKQIASEAAEIHNYLTVRNWHPKMYKIIYGGVNYGREDFRIFLEQEAIWRETCEALQCVAYARPTRDYTV